MSFTKIALFGAGGSRIRHHILQALLDDGTFKVTVVARQSSESEYPPTVDLVKMPEDCPHAQLVRALHSHEVVISTIGLSAQVQQYKLIDAAIAAGVKRFFPSEWGMDDGDVINQELCPIFKGKAEVATYLRTKETGGFSWTAVATSIWLEWALDTKFLDINPVEHTVQYWRGGKHAPSHTTLWYCTQAVVLLLKHPQVAKNQRIFLSAFEASQRQIVAELEEQQGAKYSVTYTDDEKIVKEAQARWANERDESAAYRLVTAGVLLPECKADFVSSGKKPLLEELIEMPMLTLEHVVREQIMIPRN